MPQRPQETAYPPLAAKYIARVPERPLADVLKDQLSEVTALLEALTEEQGHYRYAEGKWSIKEVIGHLIDTERMWAYRVLRIARNDAGTLSGYDRDEFVAAGPHGGMTIEAIVEEYRAVRRATLSLIRMIPEDGWPRMAEYGGHPISAAGAAYIIAGHELHHISIIRDKYLTQ